MITVRELDHIVLNVGDVDAALRFYGDVLGLPSERVDDFRRGEFPFPSVRVTSDTIIDLFPAARDGGDGGSLPATNLNHVCLVVDQTVAELRRHLDDRGIAIERGPVQVSGARGIGTSFYVRDPDRTQIELRTYDASETSEI